MADYRIVAPHFVTRITTGGHISRTGDEWVREAAPILRWAKGKSMDEFRAYAQRKRWAVEPMRDD
jgi:hypothetical protein